MTQIPPPPATQYPVGQPRRSNGAAIASLILGLAQCMPFLCGLLAVIFGFVGLKKAKDPAVGGRGMAIGGIVLGFLGLIFFTLMFTLFGGVLFWGYGQAKEAVAVADTVFQHVDKGEIDAAHALCTADINKAALTALTARFKEWGGYQKIDFTQFNSATQNGRSFVEVNGTITFGSGDRPAGVRLEHVDGQWKLAGFNIDSPQ
jgi:hypothetical protein